MILRWAGGKRWLYQHIEELIPKKISSYIEPFVGGGSFFFKVKNIESGVISDSNKNLINFYKFLMDSPKELLNETSKLLQEHSQDHYYKIRDEFNKSGCPILFLYLNRTCFNGIYRENLKGSFNVPIGKKYNPDGKFKDNLMPYTHEDFESWSNKLKKIEIKNCDFEEIILNAKDGSFIYIDPPYVDRESNKENYQTFRRYGKNVFDAEDFKRLVSSIHGRKDTCKFIISNFSEPIVTELFLKSDGWNTIEIDKKMRISGKNHGRGSSKELAIYN